MQTFSLTQNAIASMDYYRVRIAARGHAYLMTEYMEAYGID